MGTDRLRKNLRGDVVSTEGWRMSVRSKNWITYKDASGESRVFFEPTAGTRLGLLVDVQSAQDAPSRPRQLVLDRIEKACTFAGWDFIPS